jgi:histidinol phosphatase-like PHP family hydrolase
MRKKWVSGVLWDQREKSRSILTDYHMHSTYSPDAGNSLDQMCEHALRIGSDAHNLSQIGRHFDVAEEILDSAQLAVIQTSRVLFQCERLINC